MAKKNDDGALTAQTQGGELAVPGELSGGLIVDGRDDAMQLTRMAMCQGSAEEEQKYGTSIRRGDFVDVLEKRKIVDPKIMPIAGFTTWVRWEKGVRKPVYSHRNKAEVPPQDLEWIDGKPPAASECVNLIVCVEGESWPYLFVFKRTALSAFNGVISPLEGRRAAMKKGPGLYALTSIDDKGGGGDPYKRLVAKPCGDPSAELLALGVRVKGGIDDVKKRAAAMAEEQESDIPI